MSPAHPHRAQARAGDMCDFGRRGTAGYGAARRRGPSGDELRATHGQCSRTMFLVVHRECCESTLSLIRRPSARRFLAPSCAQTALRKKPIQRNSGIGADGHDPSCAESCAKSCHRDGLILPSSPGLILPSAAASHLHTDEQVPPQQIARAAGSGGRSGSGGCGTRRAGVALELRQSCPWSRGAASAAQTLRRCPPRGGHRRGHCLSC